MRKAEIIHRAFRGLIELQKRLDSTDGDPPDLLYQVRPND